MPEQTIIGAKLKARRIDLRMNQKEVADRIGVTRAAISLYELGYSTPAIETLRKLAKVLGMDLAYLTDDSQGLYMPGSQTQQMLPLPIETQLDLYQKEWGKELPGVVRVYPRLLGTSRQEFSESGLPAHRKPVPFVRSTEEGFDYNTMEPYTMVPQPGDPPHGLIIDIWNDYMEDQLLQGTKVLAQPLGWARRADNLERHNDELNYLRPGIHAVSWGNNFAVKRIQEYIPSSKTITLISDNPKGGKETIPSDAITGMWWVIRIVDAPVF